MSSEDIVMSDQSIVDVLGDGGIIKKILRFAPEDQVDTPPSGSEVTVHYHGTLASNGNKFDSSRDRNEPFKFKIGEGQVIKGWDEGVATMKRGELALFTLKPEYAYGKSGSPPSIPPNSTLNFEVELLDFNDEMEVTQGITKKVLSKGEGWRNAEEEGATAVCNYKIYEGEQVLEQRDNVTLVFGDENVVGFVEDAVGSMKLNEKAIFTVTHFRPCKYLEYTGHTAEFKKVFETELIKGTHTVKMEVTVTAIENEKNAWELAALEKLNLAESKKEQGNELFKKNRLELAKKRYERALRIIEDEKPDDEPEDQKKKRAQIISSCHSNLGAIYVKQSNWKFAIDECNKVLDVDRENIKAYYRKAQSYQSLGELEESKTTLEQCVEVCANVTEETQIQLLASAKSFLVKINNAIAEQTKKEKAMFNKMFQ